MALSATYSQQFADFFQINYQAMGRLRDSVMSLHGLVGDAYKMKYMAAVSMDQHGAYGSDIPAKNVTSTAPVISFTDYELKLAIDQFEQLNMNASVLQGYARLHAAAIGRREDQFIIDAVVADATKSVAVGTTNLTVDKLREARAKLGLDEVEGELHIVIHQNNLDSLLGEVETTSSDYNTVKTLVRGEVDSFMGFKFHVIGNRTLEGGLPKVGDNRTCIAYAKEAVTMGYRMDPNVKVVDVPENLRVETLSSFSAGAKVGDANGVVTIICDETK